MSAAHDATNREMQLRLKDEDDLRLVETASAWCASKGILMGAARAKKEGNNIYSASRSIYNNALLLEPAPITLRPTPFSKQAYEQALAMGLPFQHVVHAIASSFYNNNTHDNINAVNTTSTGQEGGWLSQAIQTAAMGDKEFTGRLVQLAQEVAANPHDRAQTVTLGILRSDYMMHSPEDNGDGDGAASSASSSSSPLSLDRVQTAIPLQVELNTIASSFGCLSTKISKLHQVLNNNQTSPDQLPDNHVTDGLASGLAAAIHEYTRQKAAQAQHETTSNPRTPIVVVMVVQPGEANSIDQRDLEFALLENHGVKMVRKTLYQLATESTYRNDETKELLLPVSVVMGQQESSPLMVEAGVVYYRAGYTPNDYPSGSGGHDVEWTGRRTVEHSAAIKCPDVFYHLVGAKKIQQALAEPGVLRQFCASDEQESLLQSCFAGLYALGDGDDSLTIQKALEHPDEYVLKPQREGGGNNLYNDELVRALKHMSYQERGAYILMQKIVPPPTHGQLVRGGAIVYDGDCVCELGIYSVTLRDYADPTRILQNDVVGHMLRTKSTATDEGGVAAGYAFLSSPHLI